MKVRYGIAALVLLLTTQLGAAHASEPGETPTSTTTTAPESGFAPSGFRSRVAGTLLIGTERLGSPWFIGATPESISGGFEYDVLADLARRLGIPTVKVVPASLVVMMTGDDCGCDLMVGGITVTDGRARTLDLTEPYLAADQAALVRKGTAISVLASAVVLRWGVALRDAAGLSVIEERIKPTAAPIVVVNEDDGVRDLANGRIDALLMDTPEALAIANTNPAYAVAGRFPTGDQYALSLTLGSPNTALVNDAIRDMRDDGTIDVLTRAYFGTLPGAVPPIGP